MLHTEPQFRDERERVGYLWRGGKDRVKAELAFFGHNDPDIGVRRLLRGTLHLFRHILDFAGARKPRVFIVDGYAEPFLKLAKGGFEGPWLIDADLKWRLGSDWNADRQGQKYKASVHGNRQPYGSFLSSSFASFSLGNNFSCALKSGVWTQRRAPE